MPYLIRERDVYVDLPEISSDMFRTGADTPVSNPYFQIMVSIGRVSSIVRDELFETQIPHQVTPDSIAAMDTMFQNWAKDLPQDVEPKPDLRQLDGLANIAMRKRIQKVTTNLVGLSLGLNNTQTVKLICRSMLTTYGFFYGETSSSEAPLRIAVEF